MRASAERRSGERRHALATLAVLAWAVTPVGVAAVGLQEPDGDPSRSTPALRIFLDCERRCDFDYIRREVSYVDYVLDRRDADVHVLVTNRRSGAGNEFSLEFIGIREFADEVDTHVFTTSDTDTDDEVRQALGSVLSLGLAPYLLRTPLATQMRSRHEAPSAPRPVAATPEEDPWNFWVFRVDLDTSLRGEERQSSREIEGDVSARRITDGWKIFIGLDGEYDERNFEFDDGERLTSVGREFGFGGQVIKTLGPRWGIGLGVAGASSTFSNLDLSTRVSAAVEHNFFPYDESSQRLLTFTYFAGMTRYDFREQTIFGHTEQTLADHGVVVGLELNRPWGEAGFTLEAAHLINDPGKHRAEMRGDLDFRVSRGLRLSVFGSASLVRDQIFLPAGGITDEEILLERRAVETDFRYRVGFGVNYTFGSIFNNVVNPRFSGSSRGFHRVRRR